MDQKIERAGSPPLSGPRALKGLFIRRAGPRYWYVRPACRFMLMLCRTTFLLRGNGSRATIPSHSTCAHAQAPFGKVRVTVRWLGSVKRSMVQAEPPAATSWPPEGSAIVATEKIEGELQLARDAISPERSQL